MRQTLIIILISLFSITGFCQPDTAYIKEAKAFLAFIRDKEIKTEHFVITSQPENQELMGCTALGRDTTLFNAKGKEAFNRQDYPLLKKWTPELLSPAIIIEQDSVTALFKDYKNRGWKYYHATYAPGLYRISAPVFLKDYSRCLLYIGYACDNSCGEGAIRLYEKSGGQWKATRSFCMWTR